MKGKGHIRFTKVLLLLFLQKKGRKLFNLTLDWPKEADITYGGSPKNARWSSYFSENVTGEYIVLCIITVWLKIIEISLIASEARYVYILRWQKSIKCQKWSIWRVFEKTWGLTALRDKSILIRQKIGGKCPTWEMTL